MNVNSTLPTALASAAGLVATIPMTITMLLGEKILKGRSRPIPPDKVVEGIMDQTGIPIEHKNETILWTSHFGFGLASGALYSMVSRLIPIRSSIWRGSIFGLGVWAVSYWGWLPATKVLPAPPQISLGENIIRIGSHLVWGSFLGKFYELLYEQRNWDWEFE